jgi:hypothetical protein
VAEVASGAATLAIWRYPRSEPLPAGAAPLAQARRELIRAARARDPALKVLRAKVGIVDGYPAITVAATEHVGAQPRRVRSVHLYAHGYEIVIDAYAPLDTFHAVDHAVFSPLGRSLRLSAARA